jgi:mRNA interferase YafQ
LAAKRNSTPTWACEDIQPTSQFKKDVKRADKRGENLSKLRTVMDLLIEGGVLPPEYKDHPLRGNFADSRDCHIEPDWVLIYALTDKDTHVRFERTGTHRDLFR